MSNSSKKCKTLCALALIAIAVLHPCTSPCSNTKETNITEKIVVSKTIQDSIETINTQISQYEKSGNRAALVDAYTAMAKIYFNSNRVEDALINANQALLIAHEVGREKQTEEAYFLLSKIHIAKDLIWESTEYLYNGHRLSKAICDTSKIAWYLLAISETEEYLGRLSNALEINLDAINFFRTTSDSIGLGRIYRAQGVVHMDLGNLTTAQSYIEKAIALLSQNHDSLNTGIAYLNMAQLDILKDKPQDAQNHLQHASSILRTKSPKYYSRCKSVNGQLLVHTRKYAAAIEELSVTATQQLNTNDRLGLASTLFMLGNAYLASGNSPKAIESYAQCLKVAHSGNLNNYIRLAFKGQAKAFGLTNKPHEAYQNLNRYVDITDSLFNLQKISEANRLENQALIKLKEREISTQQELIIRNNEKLNLEKYKQRVLFIILLLSLGVIAFAYREFKVKKNANTLLIAQKNEIEKQKNLLEHRARDITDSLNYARRIQKAILRSAQQPEEFFDESFLIFLPKELVSGDFYWLKSFKNHILFAVADCTGHGAPGAFMSIIGTFGLNQIVNELGITHPGDVLDQINELFDNSFEQREGAEIFDGMDIAFCNYNTKTRELKFAGANIYLHILRKSAATAPSSVILHNSQNHTLYQVKCDKQSIGYVQDRTPFTTHSIQLTEGDTLYIFSDGYTDQFGGPNGKKFRHTELRGLLCDIVELPMQMQKHYLEDTFTQWKGSNTQVDDVTFLGIKIT